MATITVRIDERMKDELEGAARAREMSVSDVVRGYIEEHHGQGNQNPDADMSARLADAAAPRTLSLMDRHVLTLLHRILELQGDDDYPEGYHERAAEVLRMGYTSGYDQEFAAYAREMPRRQAQLVWDIFDMFRMISGSLRRLSEQDLRGLTEDELQRLQFGGFDANDGVESALLAYGRFLVQEQGKWAELKPFFDETGGNSHATMLGRYNRMLTRFDPMRQRSVRGRGELTVEQLRMLAEA